MVSPEWALRVVVFHMKRPRRIPRGASDAPFVAAGAIMLSRLQAVAFGPHRPVQRSCDMYGERIGWLLCPGFTAGFWDWTFRRCGKYAAPGLLIVRGGRGGRVGIGECSGCMGSFDPAASEQLSVV